MLASHSVMHAHCLHSIIIGFIGVANNRQRPKAAEGYWSEINNDDDML